MVKMVETVVGKLSRQRGLHLVASAKEEQIMEKYVEEAKIAWKEVEYLKELLNQQRLVLANEKKIVDELQQEIQALTKTLSDFNY